MSDSLLDPTELRKIALFSSVSEEDLSKLTATMHLAAFDAGELIVREGDRGDSFFTILSGQAAIIKAMGTPEEQELFVAGKGDFIGEMALFEPDGVRVATVRAHTDVVALEMTRAGFDDLIHNQPQLAYEISRVLSLRVRDVNNWLQSKNELLEQTLDQLKAAQAELIDKERMERELELARKIQEDILPRELPKPENYSLGARMSPAREVGGDFFDFIRLSEHRIGVLIGDVSDKGVPAAIFMALTRSLIHAEARRSASPETVMKRVNSLLLDMSGAAMFVTALYGIMDCNTGYFEYTRAGHELPIILDDKNVEFIPPHDQGQPLALFEDPAFDTQGVQLGPGTTLLLYTDGATDATSSDQAFFGLDRLKLTLCSEPRRSAQEVCDRLLSAIQAHQQDGTQYDDITLIAIHTN